MGKPKKFGEKTAPVPFYLLQISHEIVQDGTWVSAVRSQHVTS
jgi:hypothetical protein